MRRNFRACRAKQNLFRCRKVKDAMVHLLCSAKIGFTDRSADGGRTGVHCGVIGTGRPHMALGPEVPDPPPTYGDFPQPIRAIGAENLTPSVPRSLADCITNISSRVAAREKRRVTIFWSLFDAALQY